MFYTEIWVHRLQYDFGLIKVKDRSRISVGVRFKAGLWISVYNTTLDSLRLRVEIWLGLRQGPGPSI